VLNASFHITVARVAELPTDSLAEVAFAGRSNAGKSSAINTIAHHKRLAFVSKMPGRTQHLNFFRVADQRFLVDLPGYGYARAPLEQKHSWQNLIGGYLEFRPQLGGLILIMDSRHPFTDLDLRLLEWFRATGKPLHILLSKADKLTRSAGLETLRKTQAQLSELGMQGSIQLFSSLKRTGVDEVETVIRGWLGVPAVKPAVSVDGQKKPGSRG
jgi:GTP-binding protein